MQRVEVIAVFNRILDNMGKSLDTELLPFKPDAEDESIASAGLDSLSVVEFMIYVDDIFAIPGEVSDTHAKTKQAITVGQAVDYVLNNTQRQACPDVKEVDSFMPCVEL